MVNHLDDMIGAVVTSLKSRDLFNNSLIVFSSDNGGPIYQNGSAGANNWPLRGGKMSNWEGGIRVNAFASGGAIPGALRGSRTQEYITLWDWYATFAAVAGVDPTDYAAAKAGLPPIDSFNLWPLLSGQNKTGPRREIPLGSPGLDQLTTVQGLISGDFKLLLGEVQQNIWTGPFYPNLTTNWLDKPYDCGIKGCLFNIREDPTEHVNLVDSLPAISSQLAARIKQIQETVFHPNRGKQDGLACQYALYQYGGYWGPFLP